MQRVAANDSADVAGPQARMHSGALLHSGVADPADENVHASFDYSRAACWLRVAVAPRKTHAAEFSDSAARPDFTNFSRRATASAGAERTEFHAPLSALPGLQRRIAALCGDEAVVRLRLRRTLGSDDGGSFAAIGRRKAAEQRTQKSEDVNFRHVNSGATSEILTGQ